LPILKVKQGGFADPWQASNSTLLTQLFGLGAWKNQSQLHGSDYNFLDEIMETVVTELYKYRIIF
jgi:hypothetical protein